jgi:hypothetical protein
MKCPRCGKNSIARIFWGYPADMEWYLKAIKEKKIAGGGCNVTSNDPKWKCNSCYHRWGKA